MEEEEEEHIIPLAPAATQLRSDENEAASHKEKIKPTTRKKCYGCIALLILITTIVTLFLIFGVFKDPIIILNGVNITRLELIYGTIPKPGLNMSVIAEVSIKNPNIVSFKYSNTIITIYYHGMVVGEAQGPPDEAEARRTVRVNITVDIIMDRLMSYPNLQADVSSGLFNLSSYSRIPGQVQVMKIIKKHIVVKLKCNVSFNISSQAIHELKCKRPKVDL